MLGELESLLRKYIVVPTLSGYVCKILTAYACC